MSSDEEKIKLLALRSKLAYATKNSHSWSFGDSEMELLLKNRPKTIEDLGKLKGFPRNGKRVASYGQSIIDVFNGVNVKDFDVKFENENLTVKPIIASCHFFSKR